MTMLLLLPSLTKAREPTTAIPFSTPPMGIVVNWLGLLTLLTSITATPPFRVT